MVATHLNTNPDMSGLENIYELMFAACKDEFEKQLFRYRHILNLSVEEVACRVNKSREQTSRRLNRIYRNAKQLADDLGYDASDY